MRTGKTRSGSAQSGFSMVEMLMTAFILAIGLLGLAMLQVMAMRAASGSRNLSIAMELAGEVMDQVDLEGRLTYDNATMTQYTVSQTLTGLQYITNASVEKYYNIDAVTGNATEVDAPAVGDASPLFHLTMTQTVGAVMGVSDVAIRVDFIDGISQITNLPILRTATLSRRILHG